HTRSPSFPTRRSSDLLRWNHPERGLVPPNEFIPIAEESGLITAIDQWVLRQACQQIHAWQQQDLALQFVAVNVSSRSLSNRNLRSEEHTSELQSRFDI